MRMVEGTFTRLIQKAATQAFDAILIPLRFPLEQLSRECLIMFAEQGFKAVPGRLKKRLLDFAGGMGSSVIVENLFNSLRKAERVAGSGKCAPPEAWYDTAHSSLPGDYERPVHTTGASKACAPSATPKATFVGDPEFSLDDSIRDQIHAAHPEWPAMSPCVGGRLSS